MKILKWITVLLSQVNKARDKYHLAPVTYNFEIQDQLETIRDAMGPGYFYEKGETCHYVELINREQCNRGDFIHPMGFNMIFHDTYGGSTLGNSKFNSVIQYRINQLKCFSWDLCNQTDYFDHITCLKDAPDIDYNTLPNTCIWSWYYIPRLLFTSMTQIACVQLDYKTPYVPPNITQKFSFYCYSNAKYPVSDNPFKN